MSFENGQKNVGRKAIGSETRKTGKEIDKSLQEPIKTEFN